MSSNQIPSYVPAQFDSIILKAAQATGLPVSVVAAQVDEESGFSSYYVYGPGESSAGAAGMFQFEPGTLAEYGGGSPFDPNTEVDAYIAYMKSLLKWSNGDVQKALAGYNAGQGNWQAGLGYANTILSNSKNSSSLSVGVGGSSQASTGSTPASTTASNPFPSWFQYIPGLNILYEGEQGIATFQNDLVKWLERGALMLFGALLILIGILRLTETSPTLKLPQQSSEGLGLGAASGGVEADAGEAALAA